MTDPVPARMALLTFVTVATATMTGVIAALILVTGFLRDDDSVTPVVGIVAIPVPALFATAAFLFVARTETGRKGLAGLGVFLGGLAATVLLVGLGLLGLVIASAATGGLAVLARRLLAPIDR